MMPDFISIFGFLSVVMRGVMLGFEALLIGGVAFRSLIISPLRGSDDMAAVMSRVLLLQKLAVVGLGLSQVAFAIMNSVVVMETADLRLRDVFGATFFVSACVAVLSCIVIWVLLWRRRDSIKTQVAFTVVVLLSVLATSHAWARIDNRLMSAIFTLLHHVAIGVWIGGLPYLLVTVCRVTGTPRLAAVARRFSNLAVFSVAAVLLTGACLTLLYVGSLSGLYGTSYGAMVVAKICLLAAVLGIGGVNNVIIKGLGDDPETGFRRLRRLVEAEVGLGFTIILAAASLVSQPPAIDLPNDRVSLAEIEARYRPRLPRLVSPPLESLSPATRQLIKSEIQKFGRPISYVPGVPPQKPSSPGDIAWSEYNHHWAGLVVMGIGILAVLSRTGRVSWARHWPLLFLGLAVFLFLRADPENWPLGPNGFFESFLEADVFQHRLFVVLIVGFAFFEWRVRTGRASARWMPYVFPAICAVGGVALFTHAHPLSNVKESTLIELSHLPIGVFAVFAGWSRWLELRMDPQDRKLLSWIWPLCFVAIGAILLLYREG